MNKTKYKIKFKTKLILYVTLINFLTLLLSYLIFVNTKIKDDTKYIQDNLLKAAKIASGDSLVVKNIKNKNLDENIDKRMDYYIKMLKDIDIIVIVDNDGIKYSHLIKSQIGTHFVNPVKWKTIKKGVGYFSTMKGSVGITARRFEPIFDNDKKNIIGFVMVGKYNHLIKTHVLNTVLILMSFFGISLIIAFTLSVFFANEVKKSLFNLEPEDISRLHIKDKLIVDNLESGLIIIDNNNQIADVNKVFYTKFSPLTPEKVVEETKKFIGEKEVKRFDMTINKNIYHIKILPISDEKNYFGNMILLKTRDDVDSYAREITGIDQLIEGMRANIHEFKNKLHVILGLINLGKIEAVKKYIIEFQSINEYDFKKYQNINNTYIKAVLLGKEAICKERKINFILDNSSNIKSKERNQFIDDVGTILSNLVENSIDSFKDTKIENPFINVNIKEKGDTIKISVSDNGKEINKSIVDKIYDYGFSTKGQHRGVGLHLISQKIKLYDGTIKLIIEKNIKTFNIEVKN